MLPIPPGTSWRDVMPIVLPTAAADAEETPGWRRLPGSVKRPKIAPPAIRREKTIASGGLHFLIPITPAQRAAIEAEEEASTLKLARKKNKKAKNDPGHIAAVRELRDRYLENFNRGTILALAKYDVSRALEDHALLKNLARQLRLPKAA